MKAFFRCLQSAEPSLGPNEPQLLAIPRWSVPYPEVLLG
jgi:hypothetical protein